MTNYSTSLRVGIFQMGNGKNIYYILKFQDNEKNNNDRDETNNFHFEVGQKKQKGSPN